MGWIAFVLDDGDDPEERLENALLWSAMKARLGGAIRAVGARGTAGAAAVFGRYDDRAEHGRSGLAHPRNGRQDYWSWPTFLENAGRDVVECDLAGAHDAVSRLQAAGRGAFVKSKRQKHMTMKVEAGCDFAEELGDMAYSFCDAGPCLLVQPLVAMGFEYRTFVVGGRVVAGAGCVEALTPADFRPSGLEGSDSLLFDDTVEEVRGDGRPGRRRDVVAALVAFAREMAPRLVADGAPGSFTLDVCMVEGRPAIVETNPYALGRTGLFACPLGALVEATLADCGLDGKAEASPCVGVCRIADGACEGCGRTLREIEAAGARARARAAMADAS